MTTESLQATSLPKQPKQAEPGEQREWLMVVAGLSAFVAVIAIILALFAIGDSSSSASSAPATAAAATTPAQPVASGAAVPGPTIAQAKGVAFEPYHYVDPTLPAVPAGAVKKFTVDVEQHVTQISPDLAPTEAWTYRVNGKGYPGTAASPPIVVNEGDDVRIDFVNGSEKSMNVNMPHSIDFHSAEVAPNKNYIDVMPGKHLVISFTAKHPGVFMYHCATQPVLMHTSAGMMGMMVVKPKDQAPVDRELWMTQAEYYLGAPGKPADMAKMAAETPDAIAFNGYANQYKTHPITVKAGETIRTYVLDVGPSKWSAFHVIGTVFDTTHIEGVTGHDSQTVSLAPSQGGWVEFTLDGEGNYPFVTHAFGDMVKGAAGILHTSGAPIPPTAVSAKKPAAGTTAAAATTASAAAPMVTVKLGEMFVKADMKTVKAGPVIFHVDNEGSTTHGFAIVKAPAKVSGGMVDESTFLAKGAELRGGQGDQHVSVKLAAGDYELICHIAGHYMAGQHMPFTVTG